jgi:nitroimidazol reductase NimA-like FMN-containing flavoprotein (pyridoxamine 5'-phosphate oxidase superfamily)
MATIPEGYESLLERPLYGHLATVRPDGSPQVNAMWFAWDGERTYYMSLNDRYDGPLTEPPPDKADRVILVVRPTRFSKQ